MDAELVGVEGIAETDRTGTSGEKSPVRQRRERDAHMIPPSWNLSLFLVLFSKFPEFGHGPPLLEVLQPHQFLEGIGAEGFDDVDSHHIL